MMLNYRSIQAFKATVLATEDGARVGLGVTPGIGRIDSPEPTGLPPKQSPGMATSKFSE